MPATSLRHKKNLALSDGADPSISDWNNDHDLWLGSRTIVSSGALADSDHLSTVTLASGSALAISIAPAGAGGRVRSRHHAIATMPGDHLRADAVGSARVLRLVVQKMHGRAERPKIRKYSNGNL
jgi:hypothetical protein